jgi:LysM repeat protein
VKQLRLHLIFGLVVAMLFRAAPVRAAPPDYPQVQGQITHVVQPGENLFRISLRYGTTVDAVVTANGLTDRRLIHVGQRLVIPRGADNSAPASRPTTASGTHIVQRGDTLSATALRYGVTVWALVQANGLSSPNLIYTGQRLVIPSASFMAGPDVQGTALTPTPATGDTYVVRPGDNLSQIARRFGTTAAVLARLNGIANPSHIYSGQVLRLSEAVPAPSGGGKRIVIDLSEQHLYAYQGDRLVYSFVASSGVAPYYTRSGEFRVQSKIPKAYGSTWDMWFPHWLGIYWAGSIENGIHALPILSNGQTLWAGYLGRPVSFGCIVLGTDEAQRLYNWAEIGTPVSIRY